MGHKDFINAVHIFEKITKPIPGEKMLTVGGEKGVYRSYGVKNSKRVFVPDDGDPKFPKALSDKKSGKPKYKPKGSQKDIEGASAELIKFMKKNPEHKTDPWLGKLADAMKNEIGRLQGHLPGKGDKKSGKSKEKKTVSKRGAAKIKSNQSKIDFLKKSGIGKYGDQSPEGIEKVKKAREKEIAKLDKANKRLAKGPRARSKGESAKRSEKVAALKKSIKGFETGEYWGKGGVPASAKKAVAKELRRLKARLKKFK